MLGLKPSLILLNMNPFTKSKINDTKELIALELKKARTDKNLSLEKAAQKTNINKKYLLALEEGEFDKLPTGIYQKNFLREYARFLGLDAKELLNIFDQEFGPRNKTRTKPFARKVPQARFFITFPRIIRTIIIVTIISVCLVYLAYYISNIIAPPQLTIIYPRENLSTDQSVLTVSGKTETETNVLINQEKILPDSNGFFSLEINLKPGLNTVTIIAQKKYSRENKIERIILMSSEK
ncbi:helix-turn-helix domain-containing protein [Candidatus Parcubacteria bacterium]|nr:helix-turn-helix domain-containing protein [Candidatus Parcubacteria bacterium]